MTDPQTEKPKKAKGPRLIGKWDYIGCGILTLLAALGERSAGIEALLGKFIGVLILWFVCKMVVRWLWRKHAR